MKLELTDNIYKVQILVGSQVVQLWFSAYPFLREYPIGMVDMRDLRAKLAGEEWEVSSANNSVTTWRRKESIDA